MDMEKIGKLAGTPGYWAATAVLALAAGAGVGYLVEKLTSKDGGEEEEPQPQGEEPARKSREQILAEKRSYEKAQVSPAFEKPDISNLTDYTKFFRGSGSDGDGDRAAAKMEGEEVEEKDASVFEIISEEEFVAAAGNPDGYVTATGTYFVEDGILAGWNESLEPKEVGKTVGSAAIGKFADDPDVDAVYVRNTALKVLYEVVRGEGSYEPQDDEG